MPTGATSRSDGRRWWNERGGRLPLWRGGILAITIGLDESVTCEAEMWALQILKRLKEKDL